MGMRSQLMAVIRRELCRITQHTAYLLVIVVLPVISLLFFSMLFRKGVPEKLPIAIVDYDHTSLSRQLSTMVGASPKIDIRYQADKLLAAEQLLKSGRVDALLLIPDNFERDILSLTPTNIEAYITGSNILVNGLITEALLTSITTFSTGIQIQTLQAQNIPAAQALNLAMPIRMEKHPLFNPYTNYNYYLAPSFMPMMLLIFTILATIFSYGSELRYATCEEWLNTAGGSFPIAFTGKFLTILLAMSTMLLLMFFIQFYLMNIPFNGNFFTLAIGGMVFIISYICIAVAIVALTADMRLALSLGGGYAVMAFSFSGLTFPLMAMHKGVVLLSYLFPFTYFTDIVIDQVMRGAPTAFSVPKICYMMIFWLLPLLTYGRLQRISTQSAFWGRI